MKNLKNGIKIKHEGVNFKSFYSNKYDFYEFNNTQKQKDKDNNNNNNFLKLK